MIGFYDQHRQSTAGTQCTDSNWPACAPAVGIISTTPVSVVRGIEFHGLSSVSSWKQGCMYSWQNLGKLPCGYHLFFLTTTEAREVGHHLRMPPKKGQPGSLLPSSAEVLDFSLCTSGFSKFCPQAHTNCPHVGAPMAETPRIISAIAQTGLGKAGVQMVP